jgi:hypothetical protein
MEIQCDDGIEIATSRSASMGDNKGASFYK